MFFVGISNINQTYTGLKRFLSKQKYDIIGHKRFCLEQKYFTHFAILGAALIQGRRLFEDLRYSMNFIKLMGFFRKSFDKTA